MGPARESMTTTVMPLHPVLSDTTPAKIPPRIETQANITANYNAQRLKIQEYIG